MAVVVWRICRNACQIRARVFAVLLCIICLDSVSAQEQYTAGHDTTNVVMLGDSNTWLGGDSCDRPHGWPKNAIRPRVAVMPVAGPRGQPRCAQCAMLMNIPRNWVTTM